MTSMLGSIVMYGGEAKRVAAVHPEDGSLCLIDATTGAGGTWVNPKVVAVLTDGDRGEDEKPEQAGGATDESATAVLTDGDRGEA